MFELHQSLLSQEGTTSAKEKSFEEFHMVNDIPDVYMPRGFFFKEVYDLWRHVKENLDPDPVIIDSDDLLSDPGTVLEKFCTATCIPYTENLLQWEGNPDSTKGWICAFAPPSDFDIFRVYCDTAFRSTRFLPPSPMPPEESLTQDVRECVERSMPYYREMYDNRI